MPKWFEDGALFGGFNALTGSFNPIEFYKQHIAHEDDGNGMSDLVERLAQQQQQQGQQGMPQGQPQGQQGAIYPALARGGHVRREAQQVARQGRYGDSTLMHVQPQEIAGISALLGKPPTMNPRTGLPEAWDWIDGLTMAGSIGASVFGGPLAGAAVSGLATGLRHNSLKDGLLAGAMSYGLGSAAEGLAGSATTAVSDAATKGATGVVAPAATTAATETAGQVAGQTATQGAAQGAAQGAGQAATQGAGQAATQGAGQVAGGIDLSQPLPGAVQHGSATAAEHARELANQTYFDRLGQGLQDTDKLSKTFIDNWRSTTLPIAMSGYGIAQDMSRPAMPTYEKKTYFAPESFPDDPRATSAGPPTGYRGGFDPEYRYFAEGGLASLQGQVRGPGDGMDDRIPAYVSRDEFIVPADVVSGLGDGSSNAGAERLYQMIEEVRRARTGTEKQPSPLDERGAWAMKGPQYGEPEWAMKGEPNGPRPSVSEWGELRAPGSQRR